MTHYSRTWDCQVCSERQESIDKPKMLVCEDCLRRVAQVLCKRELGVALDAPGVDQGYWIRYADATIWPMMQRYRQPEAASA